MSGGLCECGDVAVRCVQAAFVRALLGDDEGPGLVTRAVASALFAATDGEVCYLKSVTEDDLKEALPASAKRRVLLRALGAHDVPADARAAGVCAVFVCLLGLPRSVLSCSRV